MKWIGRIFALVLSVLLLTGLVSAQSAASQLEVRATLSKDGTAAVTMALRLSLDTPADHLTFPLPKGAKNVTVNTSSVRTYSSPTDPNVILADLSSLDGIVGDCILNFSYTQSDVLKTEDNKLYLELPLLCGFDLPVNSMTFYITLPGEVSYKPSYTSALMQTNIESLINSEVIGTMVTGATTQALQDRETVSLKLRVTEQMFPGKLVLAREGVPEALPMGICAGLALVYWLLLMRCPPLLRQRRTTPLEGVTAGELGSHLTAAGADLTMMVFTWAQLGYIKILPDRYGRVLLQKQMEMGNERDAFENRCFQWLFSRGELVDATSGSYAKLCAKVEKTISGIQEMYTRRAGNITLFRYLACGVSLFGGICLGLNIAGTNLLRTVLAGILAVLGVMTAWVIQSAMYRLHIRGKTVQYISAGAIVLWMLLGFAGKAWAVSLCCILAQMLAGLAAAYGGRRSDLGYFQASQILGLRHFLRTIPREQILQSIEENPDYFFELLPYAIALGVDSRFARRFSGLRLPQCTYMVTRDNPKRTPEEWALLMRKTADRMDQRQRRNQVQTYIPISVSWRQERPRRRR